MSRGPIAWMTANPVAANLLMVLILLGGLVGMTRVKQEVFPEFDLDVISVAVPYPGASPEEVEQGIVLAVEEAVRGLDGVKRVRSSAGEGLGTVSVELLIDADPDAVLADAKTAVDRITSFPLEAEEPSVTLLSGRREVVSLVISGDQDLRTLQQLGDRARAELLALPDVTQVDLVGTPPRELAIEISRETLRSYGLTLDEVAAAVRASSLELPGGGIRADSGEVLVRVSDRALGESDFADIIIRGTAAGGLVRLGDIATITDGYAETDQLTYFQGQPAVRVIAYRVGSESPQQVAGAVRAYAERLQAELPPTVSVSVWNDDSVILEGRISLLQSNALLGLVLVFLALSSFLETRLAIWVAVGIPVSFLGTFLLMPGLDLSVNMITLFALIVTLGLVVDDAIIVGENIHRKLEEGLPRLQAAIEGTKEMARPVTFSVLTSMVAFAPMLFVPGVSGKIFRLLPLVVIIVLAFSLLESFFVLPAHLAHGRERKPRTVGRLARMRARLDAFLLSVPERYFKPLLLPALRLRYATLAGALALLFVAVAAVGSGVVPFSFFPAIEGDTVTASARLPFGTPVERTAAVQRQLESSARAALAAHGGPEVVRGMLSSLGEGPLDPSGGAPAAGSHLVTVQLALVPSAERESTAAEIMAAWQRAMPDLAAVESLTFSADLGPGAGAAVELQLSHPDQDTLAAASVELAETFRSYPDLVDIDNAWAQGKPQLDLELLPAARTLGLTSESVARQLRSSFYGAEALREQWGRDEVKVMVRLPAEQRASEYHLEELLVRTPSGGEVPLSQVATLNRGRAPTSITREDSARIVSVSAALAPGVDSNREVLESLQAEVLPALKADYPGLQVELVGEQREQSESFEALGYNYLLTLFLIYGLLAIPFRSYTQPLIIMAAIPFGFVGAVAGHVLMGYNLSIISLFGIIALSGVVVNDSLVLIDSTNQLRAAGASAFEAILGGSMRRLRPILLTSVTTFLGLAPMILETDVQARFLIPMALSLGFGILFATVIILMLVPALYLILEDIKRLLGVGPAQEEAPAQLELRMAAK